MTDRPQEEKAFSGHVIESKRQTVAGQVVGVIDGYIAAWSADTGGIFGIPDQFVKGAFAESLKDHRARGNRQIRLKYQHGELIGGLPITTAFEDDVGLRATGHINLSTRLGSDVFSLIQQGVLEDLSIRFLARDDHIDGDIRKIRVADVLESSVVDEPVNQDANILSFKEAIPFQDLPIAEKSMAWGPEAESTVQRTARSLGCTSEFKRAFLWCDRSEPDSVESYKLQVAEVIDGELRVVPKALFAAASDLSSIPSSAVPEVTEHIERYLAKLDVPSPFGEARRFIRAPEAKDLSSEGLEKAMREGCAFSSNAAKTLAGRLVPHGTPQGDEKELALIEQIVKNLQESKRIVSRRAV